MGRPTERQSPFYQNGVGWTQAYTSTRTYDLAGNVKSQVYPSGRTVNYTYDWAGRLTSFTGNLGDGVSRTYATGLEYDAASRLTKEQFGTQTALYHKLRYNVRGQLYNVRLSSVNDSENWNRGMLVNHYGSGDFNNWGTSGTNNNGNVLRSHHYVPNDEQLTSHAIFYDDYSYDSLNRLASVTAQKGGSVGWATTGAQYYSYDRYGNRTINTGQTWGTGINNKSFAVDAATNRLLVPGGQSGTMSYDAAGNLTTDTYSVTSGGTRTYDAEGRMTVAWSGSVQNVYTYDAAGQRALRNVGGAVTWQVSGFDGELLAEYGAGGAAIAPQKEYGYRAGELLVTAEGTHSTDIFADTVWFEDALPAGATPYGDNEGWNWVSSNPTAAFGTSSHQSNIVAGMHQHYFVGASQALTVIAGDKLVAYVYLDPANLPSEIMLQWNESAAGWEHRAYWGANNLAWGTDGTNSRRYMGSLPAAGQWVRLEVPASVVGLEGKSVTGMAFTLYGGRATWDHAGKAAAGQTNWLVADHLGTPRIVAGKSGALSEVKRHDYLPYGEELFAGVGDRTTQQGYSQVDKVRQQFTGYERDNETGLDFAQARYFSSTQGRFTAVDPLQASARATAPQTWNRYAYAANNPLRFTDPTGLSAQKAGGESLLSPDDRSECFGGRALRCGQEQQPQQPSQINENVTVVDSADSPVTLDPEANFVLDWDGNRVYQNESDLAITMVQLPASGAGYYTYGPESMRWGLPSVVGTLIDFASQWNETHPDNPIGVGDIGTQDGRGNFRRHPSSGHAGGIHVDIRPMRSDGVSGPTAYNGRNGTYSADLTRQLIEGLSAIPNVQTIIFNDPAMGTVRDRAVREGRSTTGVHDNHLHVIFRRN